MCAITMILVINCALTTAWYINKVSQYCGATQAVAKVWKTLSFGQHQALKDITMNTSHCALLAHKTCGSIW